MTEFFDDNELFLATPADTTPQISESKKEGAILIIGNTGVQLSFLQFPKRTEILIHFFTSQKLNPGSRYSRFAAGIYSFWQFVQSPTNRTRLNLNEQVKINFSMLTNPKMANALIHLLSKEKDLVQHTYSTKNKTQVAINWEKFVHLDPQSEQIKYLQQLHLRATTPPNLPLSHSD